MSISFWRKPWLAALAALLFCGALSAKQAAKYVPLAGQAVAAVVGYSAIRYLGEEHLKDCVRVALNAGLRLPNASKELVERLD